MISNPYPGRLSLHGLIMPLLLVLLMAAAPAVAATHFKIERPAAPVVGNETHFKISALNADNSVDFTFKDNITMNFTTSVATETVQAQLQQGQGDAVHVFQAPALVILEVVDSQNGDLSASDIFRVFPAPVKP